METESVEKTGTCGLTEEQAAAVSFGDKALREVGQAALAGYAGTGKTYTVGHIVSQAVARGDRVLVVAPTHKALAQVIPRLPDGVEAMTLSKALGLRVVDVDDGSQGTAQAAPSVLSQFDLVIVDEASMVSDEHYTLVQRARLGARVLWVGDPAQLPPVGETESPVWARVERQVRLTSVIRQDAASGTLALSMRIRQRIERGERVTLDDVKEYAAGADDMEVTQGGTVAVAQTVVSALRAGCDALGIAWTNAAVDAVNRQVRAMRRGGDLRPYVPGDRVIFGRPYARKTDEEGRVMVPSSTVGTVMHVGDAERDHRGVDAVAVAVRLAEGGTIHVQAPIDQPALRMAIEQARRSQAYYYGRRHRSDQERRAFAAWREKHLALRDHYADLRDIYASTAHKAQGSTVDAAVIHWDDCDRNPSDAEFNRLMYVACTRPSAFLVVVHGA